MTLRKRIPLSVFMVTLLVVASVSPSISFAEGHEEKYVALIIYTKEVGNNTIDALRKITSKGIRVSLVVNRINESVNLKDIPEGTEALVGAYGSPFLPLLYDLGLNEIAREHIIWARYEAHKISDSEIFYSPDLAYNDLLLKDLSKIGLKAAIVPDSKYIPSGHAYKITNVAPELILLPINRTLSSLLYSDNMNRLMEDITDTLLVYLKNADFMVLSLNLDKLMKIRGEAYLNVLGIIAEALVNISKLGGIDVVTVGDIVSKVPVKGLTLGEFQVYDLRNVSIVNIYSESVIPKRSSSFPEISEDCLTSYDFIKSDGQKVLWTLFRDVIPRDITEHLLLSQDRDLTLNLDKKATKAYISIKEHLIAHYRELGIDPPEILISKAPFDGKPPELYTPEFTGEVPNRVSLDGSFSEWKSYMRASYGDIHLCVSYDLNDNLYVGVSNVSDAMIVIGYDMPAKDVLNASWIVNTSYGHIDVKFAYRYVITLGSYGVEFVDVRTKNVVYSLTYREKDNSWEIQVPRYLISDIIPRSGFTRIIYLTIILPKTGVAFKPTYFKLMNITVPSMPIMYAVDPIGDDSGPGYYNYSPRGALDLTVFSYYVSGDFVVMNVSFLSSSDNVKPIVDIYFDFEPELGLSHPIKGPNVDFLSTFTWEIAIRASDDPKATFLRIWLGNTTIQSNIYAELIGSNLIIIVPSKYLVMPKDMSSIRIAILVGKYNRTNSDHWQVIDETFGADKNAIALGVQPNVVDMLAPNVETQRKLLGSYDVSSGKIARVTGFSPKETVIVHPTPSPTSNATTPTTQTPTTQEGSSYGYELMGIVLVIIIVLTLLVLRRKKVS